VSCVLRAAGTSFDVETFCAATTLPVLAKRHVGDQHRPGVPALKRSSINVNVSDADFDSLAQQVDEAVAFLERYTDEVRRLVTFPGVEGVELEFGLRRRDVAAQTDSFPPRLVSLAGGLGLGITVSQYECAPD